METPVKDILVITRDNGGWLAYDNITGKMHRAPDDMLELTRLTAEVLNVGSKDGDRRYETFAVAGDIETAMLVADELGLWAVPLPLPNPPTPDALRYMCQLVDFNVQTLVMPKWPH